MTLGEELQQKRYYIHAIKKVRLLLMMGAIVYTFGLYAGFGDLNGLIFGFTFPALYIISGYLVLRESPNTEKRILRTILRTAICFVILAAFYFGLSYAFEPEFTLATVSTKKFWVEFLLFNTWTLHIGSTIWFVQALLYAYIIIYVIYKLKLLKLDIFLAIIFLAVTVLTGELAHVVGFNLMGHTYISGNFLTRALPYILIGNFIHRKKKFFGNLQGWHCFIIAVVGWLLIIGEYFLLKTTGKIIYTNHLFGMAFVAVAVSLCSFYVVGLRIRSMPLAGLTRFELAIPFFISSPIYYLLVRMVETYNEFFKYIGGFPGIVVLVISFAIFYLYTFIRHTILELIYGEEKSPENEYNIGTVSDKPLKQEKPE